MTAVQHTGHSCPQAGEADLDPQLPQPSAPISMAVSLTNSGQAAGLSEPDQTWKMSFCLHHPNFRQKKFTPKSAYILAKFEFATKQRKQKKHNKYTQNHSNTVKMPYYFPKSTLKVTFPTFPRTFTPKKCKSVTTN